MRPETRLLIKNTGFNAVAKVIAVVVSFALTPWLLRGFGEELYGAWALSLAIVAFAIAFDLGINTILTAHLAQAIERKDRQKVLDEVRAAAVIYGVLGIVCAGTLAVLAFQAEHIFALSGAVAYSFKWIMLINAAAQAIYWPCSVASIVLVAFRRNDITAAIMSLQTLVGAAALIFVVFMNKGPVVLAGLTSLLIVCSGAGSVVLAWHVFRRNLPTVVTTQQPLVLGTAVRFLLVASLPMFVIQLTTLATLDQVDKIALGVMVGGVAVAVYEIGARFSGVISQGISLALSATLPHVVTIHEESSPQRSQSFFLNGTRLLTTMLLPVIVMLICVAGALIPAWVGEGYQSSVEVMRILLFSQMLLPFYAVGNWFLVAYKRFRYWIFVSIVIAVSNIILTIVLISSIGIVGAALATLVISVMDALLIGLYIMKVLDIRYRPFLRQVFWPTVPALLVIPFLWLLLRTYAYSDGLVSVGVAGAVLLVGFGGIYYGLMKAGAVCARMNLWHK
ncbi:MAG: polysaccharide biosynthesis C-terminal domain-containing protein [Coriobacteriia bacterium]|nr:polysaccharide biosynthesis C-terminal domain-containing protein [Coriobacteriia bacterium]